MKKETIIRCIQGEASPSERVALQKWMSRSKANSDYYYRLYNDMTMITAMVDDKESAQEATEYNLFAVKYLNREKRGRKIFARFGISLAGVAAAIALFFVLYHQDGDNKPVIEKITFNMMSYSVISNDSQETLFYRLPDNSRVFLNENTTVYVSENYGETDRDLYIKGETYFDVVRNPSLPMHIRTDNNIIVTVTGTSFYVHSDYEAKSFDLTLTQGSVSIDIPALNIIGNDVQMVEGESITIDSLMQYSTAPIPESFYQSDNFVNNWFDFREKEMEYVLEKIEDYYMVEFVVSDRKINKFSFTGNLSNLSLDNILDIFCKSMEIHHKRNSKGQIYLSL